MQKKIGLLIILAGFIMFTIGSVAGDLNLVLVVIDETPPEWGLATDGLPAVFPRNGQTISKVDKIQAAVVDPESAVTSVNGKIDGTSYPLLLYIGTEHNGVWQANVPLVSAGDHSITITATNEVLLTCTYTGSFTVYEGLDGSWYINNIQITDPNQQVKLNTLTVAFKFERTKGTSPLTCTVDWTGPTSGSKQLAVTFPETYEATVAFTQGGTYTMTLTADDGADIVTMTVYNMELPGGFELPGLNAFQWLGIALMVAGGVVTVKGKGKVTES